MKLHPAYQAELDKLPPGSWSLKAGKRHIKIMVDGKLVAISPMRWPGDTIASHSLKNVVSAIRRRKPTWAGYGL